MTGTRRLVRLAAAVALGLGVVSGPPAGAAERELVVEATRSSWIDIEVDRMVTVRDVRFPISSTSRYVGMVIEPSARSAETSSQGQFLVLRSPELGDLSHPSQGRLHPGSYRVTVVTERPVRIVIPINEPGITVRPTRPVRATAARTAVTSIGSGLSDVSQLHRSAIPVGSQAFIAYRLTGDRAEFLRVCQTENDECPQQYGTLSSLPSLGDGARVGVTAVATATLNLIVEVEGVRLEPGELRGVVLSFRH